MVNYNISKITDFLKTFATTERINTLHQVLNNRTRYITVALENIFQSHNASAVLRSCDCFGIQNVHIIENNNKCNINRDVALGSNKWLSIYKYKKQEKNTINVIKNLKAQGYRIIATTPHTNTSINDFDISKGKFALMFGTELEGLSNDAINLADEKVKIPMYGFTESFNISVSVAVILNQLTQKLRFSNVNFNLTDIEKQILELLWLVNSVKRPNMLVKKFCTEHNINPSELGFTEQGHVIKSYFL